MQCIANGTHHVHDLCEDHLQRDVQGQRGVAQWPQLVAVVGLQAFIQELLLTVPPHS